MYKVVTSFFEGNTLHEEGSTFSHDDATFIEKCLTDGNIVTDKEADSSAAPLSSSVQDGQEVQTQATDLPPTDSQTVQLNQQSEVSQPTPNGFPLPTTPAGPSTDSAASANVSDQSGTDFPIS